MSDIVRLFFSLNESEAQELPILVLLLDGTHKKYFVNWIQHTFNYGNKIHNFDKNSEIH